MKDIQVKLLNPEAAKEAEKMMVAMARLTQSGHKIQDIADFEELLEKPYKSTTVKTMLDLPHPTIQKFGILNIVVIGLSRRALGQITRHQNEVKFMSSSLQYSDYSGRAQFVVPYEYTVADKDETDEPITAEYLSKCEKALREYEADVAAVGHDAASYQLPQGLRGVLVISATPYQIKHMISQRSCNRNTLETQYIFLKIWEELYPLGIMFDECGPKCMYEDHCPEGNMFCGNFPMFANPTQYLDDHFKYIRR